MKPDTRLVDLNPEWKRNDAGQITYLFFDCVCGMKSHEFCPVGGRQPVPIKGQGNPNGWDVIVMDESFEHLTLSPSIAQRYNTTTDEHWHGVIQDGWVKS